MSRKSILLVQALRRAWLLEFKFHLLDSYVTSTSDGSPRSYERRERNKCIRESGGNSTSLHVSLCHSSYCEDLPQGLCLKTGEIEMHASTEATMQKKQTVRLLQMTFTAKGCSRSAASEKDLQCTRKPQANEGMFVVSVCLVRYDLFQG